MFSRWFARQEAKRQLYRMTDRELHDIGIGRCDIDRVVDKGMDRT